MKQIQKRRGGGFRTAAFLLLALLGFWYWSTFTLTVTRVALRSDKIRNEVRIVQISDLHGSQFGPENQNLLERIRREAPDLVVVTGDMYTAHDEIGRERAVSLLGKLAMEYPTYYINGEHDNSDSFFREITAAGVDFLDYETRKVTVKDTKITLYGITNVYYSPTFDLENEFTLDRENYTVLLAHSQNLRAFAQFGVDLALCGDSHGGQVRLPILGAVYNSGYWFPEEKIGSDCEFTKGLYRQGDTTLFITGGLGNYPLPFRLFNRPEIAVISLLPEES